MPVERRKVVGNHASADTHTGCAATGRTPVGVRGGQLKAVIRLGFMPVLSGRPGAEILLNFPYENERISDMLAILTRGLLKGHISNFIT